MNLREQLLCGEVFVSITHALSPIFLWKQRTLRLKSEVKSYKFLDHVDVAVVIMFLRFLYHGVGVLISCSELRSLWVL